MTIYRVRKIGTELYSDGGMFGRFSKTGRAFKAGPLKCHFAQLKKYADAGRQEVRDYLASVEVVPFIVGEVERSSIPLAEFLGPV